MSRKKLPLVATKGQTTSAKHRMLAVAGCCKMSQPKKSRVLNLRAATISECEKILWFCKLEFVNKLPDHVDHAPVFRFAQKCEAELNAGYYNPTRLTPAREFLAQAISSDGEIDVQAMELLCPVRVPKWWEHHSLVTIAKHQMFIASYPEVARLLLDASNPNHKSIVDWLVANPNPVPKTGVKKLKK